MQENSHSDKTRELLQNSKGHQFQTGFEDQIMKNLHSFESEKKAYSKLLRRACFFILLALVLIPGVFISLEQLLNGFLPYIEFVKEIGANAILMPGIFILLIFTFYSFDSVLEEYFRKKYANI